MKRSLAILLSLDEEGGVVKSGTIETVMHTSSGGQKRSLKTFDSSLEMLLMPLDLISVRSILLWIGEELAGFLRLTPHRELKDPDKESALLLTTSKGGRGVAFVGGTEK